MKIVHEIMYKVEVLYVLCVLLMGRQRNQVPDSTLMSSVIRIYAGALHVLLTPALCLCTGPQDAG